MADQCDFMKPNGERCRGRARVGSTRCPFHDPALAGQQQAARQAGGRQRSRQLAVLTGAADVTFSTVADVTRLIGETVSQVRRGDIDAKIANAIFYGSSVALRALMPDELTRQVEELRRRVEELKGKKHGGRDNDNPPHAVGPAPGGGAPPGDDAESSDVFADIREHASTIAFVRERGGLETGRLSADGLSESLDTEPLDDHAEAGDVSDDGLP